MNVWWTTEIVLAILDASTPLDHSIVENVILDMMATSELGAGHLLAQQIKWPSISCVFYNFK